MRSTSNAQMISHSLSSAVFSFNLTTSTLFKSSIADEQFDAADGITVGTA
jgi:hypothetical protein